MGRNFKIALAGALSLLVALPQPALAGKPPATWDALVEVKSKRLDAVYLLPEADFRTYTKVMLDPTEVAFQKNWLRNYNSSSFGLSSRISEADMQKWADEIAVGFQEDFTKAYSEAGYEVVTQRGPDVLRVRTAVVNIDVAAPDTSMSTAGMSRTYSRDAGSATMVLEVRDSVTGAVLGRAIDGRVVGDSMGMLRNSMTNRSDFHRLFRSWADISIKGLAELKALSPIDVNAKPQK